MKNKTNKLLLGTTLAMIASSAVASVDNIVIEDNNSSQDNSYLVATLIPIAETSNGIALGREKLARGADPYLVCPRLIDKAEDAMDAIDEEVEKSGDNLYTPPQSHKNINFNEVYYSTENKNDLDGSFLDLYSSFESFDDNNCTDVYDEITYGCYTNCHNNCHTDCHSDFAYENEESEL